MDNFDLKAYSLMHSHFLRTRETKKKKEMKDDGRQLWSKTVLDNIHNKFDYESSSVITSNTRRLSRYILEDFLPLPEQTPLLLLIPTANSIYSDVAQKAKSIQPDAKELRMGGILY